MNVREQLALGIHPELDQNKKVKDVVYDTVLDEVIPEGNSFLVKSKERLTRMLKSQRARNWRHKLKDIHQNQHMRGFI